MSYDDREVLSEFSAKQEIPFPLLSDLDSKVIRSYGILNEQVEPGDAMLYGIPYPGTYVCDGEGRVVSKFFHDSYKKRDSAERYLDAALGRLVLDECAPAETTGNEEVRVTAAVHGGDATLRQGVIREVVVRFELGQGLHLYGEPSPEGFRPVQVAVEGPPGLVVEPAAFPPTEPLTLEAMDVTLNVWHDELIVRVPFYPVGELVSEVRPLDAEDATLRVKVSYQACDDSTCLLPQEAQFEFKLKLDVVDIPDIALHQGHGQRAGNYDGTPHLKRLMRRKILAHPLGFLRFLGKTFTLERAARKRRLEKPPPNP